MMVKRLGFLFILFIATTGIVGAQTFKSIKSKFKSDQQRIGQFAFISGFGSSSYYGDLKNSQAGLDFKPNIILGLQNRVHENINIRGEFTWYMLEGADKNNEITSPIFHRNLSFKSQNLEFNISGVVNLFPRYDLNPYVKDKILNPYAFAGIGFTKINPTTVYEGQTYRLRPLQTEGIEYNDIVFVIPAGFGISFRLNETIDLSIEGGYRFTFSDYLDDVSQNFYHAPDFFDNPISAALHDRRPELGLSPALERYPRGNPNKNDSYLLMNFKTTYYFNKGFRRRIKYGRPKSG